MIRAPEQAVMKAQQAVIKAQEQAVMAAQSIFQALVQTVIRMVMVT